MEIQRTGDFGANIKLKLQESGQRQLFLVRSSSLETRISALVRSHGGRIVIKGRGWVIAELGVEDSSKLRKVHGITFVGGVYLDPKRFEAFSRLTGFDL